jgi:hypothetical protein
MALIGYSSNVVANSQTAESGKFVQLDNDTRFPAVSVTRFRYLDTSEAYTNTSTAPITSVEIYPKFAILTYNVNTLGSGGIDFITAGQTKNEGYIGLQALSATTISGITASNTTGSNFVGVVIPAGQTIYASIRAISISAGGAILYKND